MTRFWCASCLTRDPRQCDHERLHKVRTERDALLVELETRKNEIETLKDMLTDAVEEKEMAEAELNDIRRAP